MAERYATIITNDKGEEEVSAIAVMESGPPEIRTGKAKVAKVPGGVQIGMIKGGTKNAVGGFGFREDAPGAEVRSPTDAKPAKAEAKG